MRRSAARARLGRASPALRGIAIAATLGLLLAEWASFHHLATGAHRDSASPAIGASGAQLGAEGSPELVAQGAPSAGDLAHDRCQICHSSRDRIASPAASVSYTTGPVHPSLAPLAERGERIPGAAIYAVAPKTSPPARA